MSDDGAIPRFLPRASSEHDSPEALVWAIDDEHVPAYWFPRDCPRGTFWAIERTSEADIERFLTGDRNRRVHAIQADWLEQFRTAELFAYELPGEPFEPYPRAAGYWVAREAVEPRSVSPLGDLLARHAAAGIELRIVPDLGSLWERVAASTLEFSGIRLRNLHPNRPPGDKESQRFSTSARDS